MQYRDNNQQLWEARDGASAVEFALIAGILAMMLLGLMDFGLGFWEKMEVGNGARAGAEYAVRNGYDSSKIQTAVTNSINLSGLTISSAESCGCPNATAGINTSYSCGETCPDGGIAGTYVTVDTQASYHTIFHWPGVPNPITLASSSTVRIN